MASRILFLFDQDLRLADNQALMQACLQAGQLQLVAYLPDAHQGDRFGNLMLGEHRRRFMLESIHHLQQSLSYVGQHLELLTDDWLKGMAELVRHTRANKLFCSRPQGYWEQQRLKTLQQVCGGLEIVQLGTDTLFQHALLPFTHIDFPRSFSKFRKLASSRLQVAEAIPRSEHWPAPISKLRLTPEIPALQPTAKSGFVGGEAQGMANWQAYLASGHAQSFKETRDRLDGWYQSTKLSPWLASGCLSVRQVWHQLKDYETRWGANASTEWIAVELLWREYFHWYGHFFPRAVFLPKGRLGEGKTGCFYSERFRKWCEGNTPWPLVNACMKQLNETGYMSNRGRQLVASALVHEMGIDWRAGAGYFQQQLLDFDLPVNWGNWQYIAGVFGGQQPKHFDLEWQTARHDPAGEFVRLWQGEQADGQLDHSDAADWPC